MRVVCRFGQKIKQLCNDKIIIDIKKCLFCGAELCGFSSCLICNKIIFEIFNKNTSDFYNVPHVKINLINKNYLFINPYLVEYYENNVLINSDFKATKIINDQFLYKFTLFG